jgi:hypothetical protein
MLYKHIISSAIFDTSIDRKIMIVLKFVYLMSREALKRLKSQNRASQSRRKP